MTGPVFLIGTGRCGSSLLQQLLGYHPDLAWMSHWTSWMPGGARWAFTQRLHDLPAATQLLVDPTSRVMPQPTENYRLLAAATDGLFTAPRELTADDLTPLAKDRLHRMVDDHLRASGKARFMMKHTGYPRVAYLRAAFPDARFVHVVRDGRAVAVSLCKVDWWSGESQWGFGRLSDEDRSLYADSGYHEVVLAGLYWKVLMDQFAAVKDEGLLEVRYDTLVTRPAETMAEILRFVDLPPNGRFDERLAATRFLPEDARWRKALSTDEVTWLERALGPALTRHGYTPLTAS